jgi:uncharacterized RDD family membrane protein YckC
MSSTRSDGRVPELPPSLPPRVAPSLPGPSAPPLVSRPTFEFQPMVPLAPGQLPRGMTEVSPWGRLGAYLLESVLIYAMVLVALLPLTVFAADVLVSLLIYTILGLVWAIWALVLGTAGQTPAKHLLGHTVIAADTHRPVGLGRMFWVRGFLCGFIVPIAVICTLGIVLFMPFWNKRNQNLWDRISHCYVVHRP